MRAVVSTHMFVWMPQSTSWRMPRLGEPRVQVGLAVERRVHVLRDEEVVRGVGHDVLEGEAGRAGGER